MKRNTINPLIRVLKEILYDGYTDSLEKQRKAIAAIEGYEQALEQRHYYFYELPQVLREDLAWEGYLAAEADPISARVITVSKYIINSKKWLITILNSMPKHERKKLLYTCHLKKWERWVYSRIYNGRKHNPHCGITVESIANQVSEYFKIRNKEFIKARVRTIRTQVYNDLRAERKEELKVLDELNEISDSDWDRNL
jgi:hypothetical protein